MRNCFFHTFFLWFIFIVKVDAQITFEVSLKSAQTPTSVEIYVFEIDCDTNCTMTDLDILKASKNLEQVKHDTRFSVIKATFNESQKHFKVDSLNFSEYRILILYKDFYFVSSQQTFSKYSIKAFTISIDTLQSRRGLSIFPKPRLKKRDLPINLETPLATYKCDRLLVSMRPIELAESYLICLPVRDWEGYTFLQKRKKN